MINSLSRNLQDIYRILQKSSQQPFVGEDEVTDKTLDFIRFNALSAYFIRMSWINKLGVILSLSEKMPNLYCISLILNTMSSSHGKLISYAKSNFHGSTINFDKILLDHNRMLKQKDLNQMIASDLIWFENLDDNEKVAIFINLTRIAGEKKNKSTTSQKLKKIPDKAKTPINKKLNKHKNSKTPKTDDPNHEHVLQLSKKWDRMIKNYEKKINKPEKKTSRKKNTLKKQDAALDWLQIMPIFIVKKCLGYLDKKSLIRAKKVNSYWKWVIQDHLKDVKVQKLLNKTIKQYKNVNISLPHVLPEAKHALNKSEQRMKKLEQRGAAVESLRHFTTDCDSTQCLLVKTLHNVPVHPEIYKKLEMYARNFNNGPVLFQKPKYLVKDYKIICRVVENEDDESSALNDKISQDVKSSMDSEMNVDKSE